MISIRVKLSVIKLKNIFYLQIVSVGAIKHPIPKRDKNGYSFIILIMKKSQLFKPIAVSVQR